MSRSWKACRFASRTLRAFGPDTRGSVAIEFGLFSAMLAPLLVLAVDLGFLLRERIVMDHTVRAGVFAATREGSTTTSVEDAMRAAFDGQGRERVSIAALSVVESCFCPENPENDVSCNTSCPPGGVVGAYTITLSLAHDGMLLPPGVPSDLGMLDSRVRVEFPAWAR